jgi:hypothetical protein
MVAPVATIGGSESAMVRCGVALAGGRIGGGDTTVRELPIALLAGDVAAVGGLS